MRLLVVLLLLALPCVAEPKTGTALRLTTDSVEYCGRLAARLAALPGAAEENVRSLAEDGMRLCENGHFRTGVAKLRRALRMAQPQ
jgi:hypothetical protein